VAPRSLGDVRCAWCELFVYACSAWRLVSWFVAPGCLGGVRGGEVCGTPLFRHCAWCEVFLCGGEREVWHIALYAMVRC
jgi:hypothetical protein